MTKQILFSIGVFSVLLAAAPSMAIPVSPSRSGDIVSQEDRIRAVEYLNSKEFFYAETDPLEPCHAVDPKFQSKLDGDFEPSPEERKCEHITIECVPPGEMDPEHMGECRGCTIRFRSFVCDYVLPHELFPEYEPGQPGKHELDPEQFESWKKWLWNTRFEAPILGVLACHAIHEATHALQPSSMPACMQEYWAHHEQIICLNRHRRDCLMSSETDDSPENPCRSIDEAIESKTLGRDFNACLCGWGDAISPVGTSAICNECSQLCVLSNPSNPYQRQECESLKKVYCS